jgi:hypothetical protein
VVGAAAAALAKSLLLVAGTVKLASYTAGAVLSGGALAALGVAGVVAGVVAIILIAIAIGVDAGIRAVSNQQAIDEGDNLTSLLNQARNTPPDLSSFATDSSGLGMYKLQATFDAQTLPEAPSTATLPPHGLSDLNFAILIANGTKTTISNTLAYQDWSGINWSAQTSGGWFVQQCNSGANCRQPDSITGKLRFVDWSGTKWTALRLGDKFTVTKEKPAATDNDCEPSPVTGVSPGSDFSNCKSYLSESIQLRDPNGVLETVSFSVLAPPVFSGPTTLPFTPKVASGQVITVSGNPTPRICFAGSTPPLPSDFTLNGAPLNTNACAEGSFKLTFNGNAASPQQTYLLTLVAANGSSTQPVSGGFFLDVSPHLGIISPSHLTGRAGFPVNFLVEATGFPTPTLTVDPGVLVSGLSFKDNGNGTATISGIVPGGVSHHRCLIFNGGDCGIRASNSQGRVIQGFSITMNPAPRASLSEPTSATFIWGAPNSVTLTSSGASTPVSWELERGTAPAWLHFTDNGDGTAKLFGTPPKHAVGKHEPVVSPIAFGSGPFVFFVKYPIHVVDIPVFLSSPTAAFTVGSFGSFTASVNQGKIGLVGTLPTGLSFSPPGTLDCLSLNNPNAACITGTPAAGTTGQYNVVLTDDAGSLGSISQPLTINVYQSPAITSSNMATFITGTPSTFAVTTTGFPNTSTQPVPPNSGPPTSPNDGKGMFFTVVRGLPADLRFSNLNPAGFATGTLTITGVPSAADAGLHPVQITAQNGVGAAANQTILLNILPLTAPAPAAANACNGNYNGVFAGDLAVSGGQNCTFVGGGVTGNILVDGGSLALFGATINQNVTIQGASSAFAIDSGTKIGGSLNISGIGNPPRNEICGSVVNGDVIIDGNMTPLQIGSFAAACLGNVFGGNLTVMNSSSMGIYNNVIGNTLACTNDTNIIGQGNAAAAKTGVCAPF